MTRKQTAKRNGQPATSTVDVSRQLDALQVAKKAGVLTEAEYERKRVPLLNALHEIDGLERQALAAGGVPLGVTINTPLVVAGELIESAWGNQVRTDLFALNSGKVEKTGDSMSGSLTFSGGSTQIVLPNDPTLSTHAARRAYVDAAIATATAPVRRRMTRAAQSYATGGSALVPDSTVENSGGITVAGGTWTVPTAGTYLAMIRLGVSSPLGTTSQITITMGGSQVVFMAANTGVATRAMDMRTMSAGGDVTFGLVNNSGGPVTIGLSAEVIRIPTAF